MPSTVIITLSDSRGKGLDKYLQQQLPPHDTVVDVCRPGADLEKLFLLLKQTSTSVSNNSRYAKHNILVVLFGGICSYTTRARHDGGLEVTYNRKGNRVQLIKSTLDLFRSYCNSHQYKLIIATIIPADLEKSKQHHLTNNQLRASAHTVEETAQQQLELEEDISSTNQYIVDCAREGGHQHLNLHRELLFNSLKGKRKRNWKYIPHWTYAHLQDGIHPDQALCETIFTKIGGACRYALESHTDTDSTQSETESAIPQKTWDFKRRVVIADKEGDVSKQSHA